MGIEPMRAMDQDHRDSGKRDIGFGLEYWDESTVTLNIGRTGWRYKDIDTESTDTEYLSE